MLNRRTPLLSIWILSICLMLTAPAPGQFQTVVEDDFSTHPVTYGDWTIEALKSVSTLPHYPALIGWDSANQNISAIWDAGKPSSVYGVNLGRTVTQADDFAFAFSFTLENVNNPSMQYFEIAVGLDDSLSTRTRCFDRSGKDFMDPKDPRRSKNIAEWAWVPTYDWGFGPSSYMIPTVCPDPGEEGDVFRNHLGMVLSTTALQPSHVYRVHQIYNAAAHTFTLTMLDNGVPITTEDVSTDVALESGDVFTMDRFTIKSYHNRYNFDDWVIEGTVDDVQVWVNGEEIVNEDFTANPGWSYVGLRDYGLPQKDLVSYDAAGERVEFTWDALRPSTALSYPTPQDVTDRDSFTFEFDLELTDINVNGDYFEISVGLHNAGDHLFDRSGKDFYDAGDPTRCKNIADWTWVPSYDWGYGPDSYIAPTLCPDPGQEGDIFLNHFGLVLTKTELQTGVLYHVRQAYDPATREMTLTMTADGQLVTTEDVTTSVEVPDDNHFTLNRFGPVSYYNRFAYVPGDWQVTGYIDNVRLDIFKYPGMAAAGTWEMYD
ncbi:hypothetical protein HQ520_12275 [bacterium]|nr:hypothetical protein [bacterium]